MLDRLRIEQHTRILRTSLIKRLRCDEDASLLTLVVLCLSNQIYLLCNDIWLLLAILHLIRQVRRLSDSRAASRIAHVDLADDLSIDLVAQLQLLLHLHLLLHQDCLLLLLSLAILVPSYLLLDRYWWFWTLSAIGIAWTLLLPWPSLRLTQMRC